MPNIEIFHASLPLPDSFSISLSLSLRLSLSVPLSTCLPLSVSAASPSVSVCLSLSLSVCLSLCLSLSLSLSPQPYSLPNALFLPPFHSKLVNTPARGASLKNFSLNAARAQKPLKQSIIIDELRIVLKQIAPHWVTVVPLFKNNQS